LEPNGKAAPGWGLKGSVTTDDAVKDVLVTPDAQRHLVVRFPLKAGTRNAIVAHIDGAPLLDPDSEEPPYEFQILDVRSARVP
jgi:hypothetical protein